MSETAEAYRARLLSYIAESDYLDLLREAPRKFRDLLARCPKELLEARSGGDRWTIRHIIGHVAEDEVVLGYRLRSVLADNGCPIAGFDQDRWSAVMRYDEIDPYLSAERFAVMRAWNVEVVSGRAEEELDQYGMHSERGRESVKDMLLLHAGHDINHFMQIERIIGLNA